MNDILRDHEEQIIWCAINVENSVYDIVDKITTKDLLHEENVRIFRCIQKIVEESGSVYLDAIKRRLTDSNDIKHLERIQSNTVDYKKLPDYISYIKEEARKRKLRLLTSNINSQLASGDNSDKVVSDLLQCIIDIDTSEESQFTDSKSIAEGILANLDLDEDEIFTGYKTGIDKVDKFIDLEPGNIYIVAARTSMGKSILAKQIAAYIADRYKMPVPFFSLEMSKEKIMNRIIATEADVDHWKIKKRKLGEIDKGKIRKAIENKIKDLSIYFDDKGGTTFFDIVSKCKALKIRKGELGPIFIDYLQLMKIPESNGETRDRAIGRLTSSLKALAKELEVPIICMCQVNRSTEGREDNRPRLSDLRESGNIEQDADGVIFIYRDTYYTKDEATKNKAEIIIDKNRDGEVGTAYVNVDLAKQYFYD